MTKSLVLAAACATALIAAGCATTEGEPAAASAPAVDLTADKAAGQAVFQASCNGCHGSGRAPAQTVLAGFTPEHVVMTLTTGKMAMQGRNLSDEQKRQVATYLTGKAPA